MKIKNAHAMIANISVTFRKVVDFTDPFALFLADLHANAPSNTTMPAINKLPLCGKLDTPGSRKRMPNPMATSAVKTFFKYFII